MIFQSYQLFLVFIFIGVLVSLISERIKTSYTSFLLLLGMSLSLMNAVWKIFPQLSVLDTVLSAQVFFGIVLPPIIFKASIDIDYQSLRKNIVPIIYLATVGVLLSTLLIGIIIHYILSLGWFYSFLFATIISPTDPVGVIVLLHRYNAPSDTSTLVEGEALINDATAITLFVILISIGGGAITYSSILAEAGLVTLVSPAIGLIFGIVTVQLINRLQSYESRVTATLVTSYLAFTITQAIGGSGILAEIITGMIITMKVKADVHRKELNGFWSVLDYIMTSLIFMAMGLIFNPFLMYSYIFTIAVAFLTVFIVRVLLVRTLNVFKKFNYDFKIAALSGIRGAIPIVLALNLASYIILNYNYSQLIFTMTIGVAGVSLLVQATVAQWMIRRKYKV